MIKPQAAPVRPRVMLPESGAELPIEDVVESYIAEGLVGQIALVGGPGSGKSTALAHLASQTFADELLLADDATSVTLASISTDRLVVVAAERGFAGAARELPLAPWTVDDVIELLLAKRPAACASVISRFSADPDVALLHGNPFLCRLTAEQMAEDESLVDVRTALRRAVADAAESDHELEAARRRAQFLLTNNLARSPRDRQPDGLPRINSELLARLLEFRVVNVLLAADEAIARLRAPQGPMLAVGRIDLDLINELGRMLRADQDVVERCQRFYETAIDFFAAIAASVLFAASPLWRPIRQRQLPSLAGGIFPRAEWGAIELSDARLESANLARANLRRANLTGADLNWANLRGIDGRRIQLINARARHASLERANLAHADLAGAAFVSADLSGANLSHANAKGADFRGAKLTDVCFEAADLRNCCFSGARLARVDFRRAILHCANFGKCQFAMPSWTRPICRARSSQSATWSI